MKRIVMNLAFVGLLLPAFSLAQTTAEAEAAKIEVGMIHCSEEMENLSVEVIGKAMG